MRKITGMLLAFVLSATMAVAQASSPQQQQSTAQTPATAPAQTPATAPQTDRGTQPNQGSTAASPSRDTNPNAASTQPQTPDQTPSTTQRAANTRGNGVPWGWIIVGIVVIAIILGLIGRGSSSDRVVVDRDVERDRTVRPTPIDERRDDDIRRVG